MVLLFIGNQRKNANYKNPLFQKWYLKGLAFKLLSCIGFCLVYTYYYDYGGDTRGYFRDTQKIVESMSYGFSVFWDVLQRNTNNIDPTALDFIKRITYNAPMEYYTVHLSLPFNILGFGSYFAMSLLISFFCYAGVWRFFLLFVEKFPKLEKEMAFAILFVPSVVFWGSGLNKDTFIFCFVGLFLYYVNKLFDGKVFNFKYILIAGISAYLIFIIKAYVIISLLPAVLVWRTLYLRDKIKVGWLKALVLPVFGSLAIVVVVYALSIMGQYNKKYSVDSFVSSAQSMQGWHYQEGHNTSEQYGRGSSYTLGDYEETPMGLLSIFPAAVNVTFFRPYIWEAKNMAMLAQAIESLLFLFFTIYILIKVGPFKVYSYISNDSFLLMCVVFAIFFGFAVGFSSYNFGALSRYKIQCVPFFVAALFIIRYKHQQRKQVKVDRIMYKRQHMNQSSLPGFAGNS